MVRSPRFRRPRTGFVLCSRGVWRKERGGTYLLAHAVPALIGGHDSVRALVRTLANPVRDAREKKGYKQRTAAEVTDAAGRGGLSVYEGSGVVVLPVKRRGRSPTLWDVSQWPPGGAQFSTGRRQPSLGGPRRLTRGECQVGL